MENGEWRMSDEFSIINYPFSIPLHLLRHLEARALLHPLPCLDRSVAVQVGAEVAVSADADVALEAAQQLGHQQARCSGVRVSLGWPWASSPPS